MSDVTNTAGNSAAPENQTSDINPEWFDDVEDQGGSNEQPEAKASEEQPGPEEKPEQKSRTVPHQALHAERVRRQQVEQQLVDQQRRWELAEQRMADLAKTLEQRNAPPVPDPNQDPIGYIKYLESEIQSVKGETEAQKAERAQQERARQEYEREQSQISQIDNAYRSAWVEKLEANPDAADAYQAFVQTLDAHFQIRGIVDPQQRAMAIHSEERAIAVAALQQGRDPAEAIISQAKIYGYVPKAPDANAAIQNKQEGMKAARSLSTVGGKAGNGGLPTASQLADMPIEEYEEFRSRLSPRQLAKLLGAP